MDLVLEVDLPEARLAATTGLVVLDWRKTPTLAATHRVCEHLPRVLQSPTPQLVLTIANAANAPPDGPTRDTLTQNISALAMKIAGVAFVVEGSGFGAAATRGIVSGLYLVTKPSYPVKVFSTLVDAANWLIENWKIGQKPQTSDILEAITKLRIK